MKASVMVGQGTSRIVDVPVPRIEDKEVLIRVRVCGVCASELYTWANGLGSGDLILGHELVGIIEDMGEKVEGFNIGDRVTGLMHGGFAQYTKADYRNLVKVPEGLHDVEAIGEPLSCMMSGIERIPINFDDTVAIIGNGFMGLGLLQLVKLKNPQKIIAIDTRQDGLDNASSYGADIMRFPDEVEGKYLVTEWEHIGRGVEIAIEACGAAEALNLAGNMVAVHGVLGIAGYHQNGMRKINMELWNWKAITIINAHERRHDVHIRGMKTALSLIEQGRFNMNDMITHEFELENMDKAFESLQKKPSGFVKAVIYMD